MKFIESENVELKESYVEDIRKEIIAFANTSGGKLYIGVRDDGEVTGVDDPDGDTFESMRSLNQLLTFNEATRVFSSCELELQEIQMKTLGMINEEGMYTNLALLLSDQCPHIIKAASFRGTDQSEFQDRKEFTGSILKQLSDAFSYLDMRNQTRATFEGLYRIDSRDYAESALRESLLNAIVHRDYSFSASTLISVYDDRIEMVSYGGIAGNVSMEDVLNGLSVCRNEKLANIFYRLKLIEAYGTGLKKIQNAYNNSAFSPEFSAGPGSFRVVLPNMNSELHK